MSLGKLNLAPIGANPQNVLDIGTGQEAQQFIFI
jgi:hypothetical protein